MGAVNIHPLHRFLGKFPYISGSALLPKFISLQQPGLSYSACGKSTLYSFQVTDNRQRTIYSTTTNNKQHQHRITNEYCSNRIHTTQTSTYYVTLRPVQLTHAQPNEYSGIFISIIQYLS